MGKADLHTHTTASDGSFSPEELLIRAKKKGLQTLAITDHDSIKGYLAGKVIAKENGIELISGVEFTVSWEGREVHLLAYLFDEENEDLISLLYSNKKARKDRMKRIVTELRKNGVDIEYDEVMAESGRGMIGRPHAASVLVQKGYVRSVNEAFIRYLSSEKLGDVDAGYRPIEEVVRVVSEAGGVTSLAHPGPLYSDVDLKGLIATGIDGIECIHPSHSYPVQKKFSELAKANHLLMTGGSDFHGTGRSDYDPFFGIVTIGDQYVASMRRLSDRRKQNQ
ncbi:MAG: PHP domain-containing protein [Balneolaceae bacterium]|nr:PHP domain-containing protein [Balneolaceae bacterium]MCH8547262.1 PHP domain-containing protein [Balneolaceae bacterium]